MKILIIDNYDSFTYNLVYLIKELNIDFDVIRNDKILPEDITGYAGILLSPGPGIPSEAGQLLEIIKYHAGKIPILGVCLGHQAMTVALGGQLTNMDKAKHGLQSTILTSNESPMFNGMMEEQAVGHYHSWIVEEASLPVNFRVTARDQNGEIMAIEDQVRQLYGVQFHPESILTPEGATMIKNFVNLCERNIK